MERRDDEGARVASPARIEAAAALRRLVRGVVGHEGSEADLRAVTELAGGLADRLEAQAPRVRPAGDMLRYPRRVGHGGELSCWPDCMVAGSAHPSSTGLVARRSGDEAVGTVVLGPAHEGPPGRAHGGLVASLFDEIMGFATWMDVLPAYTAWLRVDYRSGVPIGAEIELRARITRRERRKLFLTATAAAAADGRVLAEAEGLFVVPREYAGLDGAVEEGP